MPNTEILYQMYLRQSGSQLGERAVQGIVGLVEAPAGHISDYTMNRAVPIVSGDERSLSGFQVLPDAIPASKTFPNYERDGYNADAFLTQPGWPLSSKHDSGVLLYRKTSVPASKPDREVFSVIGMIATRSIDYDPEAILTFGGNTKNDGVLNYAGRLGYEIDFGWTVPKMIEATRGKTYSQILRMPTWGFNDEAYEMGMDIPEAMAATWLEARNLVASGLEVNQLPEELQERLKHYGGSALHDEGYVQAIRHIHEHFPDQLSSDKIARTRREFNEAMSVAVAHIMGKTSPSP